MRPSHIRVARLAPLIACDRVTAHRRAKAGIYGHVTRDDEGRSQVEIAAVEVAEGRVFTDAEIARAAGTPSSNTTNIRRAVERMAEIEPARQLANGRRQGAQEVVMSAAARALDFIRLGQVQSLDAATGVLLDDAIAVVLGTNRDVATSALRWR